MSDIKKKNIALKDLRYVEVRWLDAASEASWTPINDCDIVASPCISRGWVMKQDDTQILLCGTVGMDGEGLVEEANTIISIPSPMVQSVTDFPIRLPRRRGSKKKHQHTLLSKGPEEVAKEETANVRDSNP